MNKLVKDFVVSNRFLYRIYLAYKHGSPGYLAGPRKQVKGKNNKFVFGKGIILFNTAIDIEGEHNLIEIGNYSTLRNVRFHIRGDNNVVKIGSNVIFNLGGCLWVEDGRGSIEIADGTTFEETHLAVTEPGSQIIIGKDCMFAKDIDVRTGDSHAIIDAATGKRINYAKSVRIGDHVWVGAHVSILKGVTIAANSIVGTRSLVTKPFTEGGVILGGVPAKVLLSNTNWTRERTA